MEKLQEIVLPPFRPTVSPLPEPPPGAKPLAQPRQSLRRRQTGVRSFG